MSDAADGIRIEVRMTHLILPFHVRTPHLDGRNSAPALLTGGDHGLRPPGPLRAYAQALGDVGTPIEEFLSQPR